MRQVLGALIGVMFFAAGPGNALAISPASQISSGANEITEQDRKEFRTEVLEGSSVLRLIQKYYPQEYATFETEILIDFKTGTLTVPDAATRAYDFTKKMTETAGATAWQASSEDVTDLVTAQLTTQRAISRYSLKACYEFSETGQLSRETASGLGEDALKVFEPYTETLYRVGKSGADHPVKHPPITDAEAEKMVDAFLEKGGELPWLQGLSSGDFSQITPNDRCKSGIALQEAILSMPKDSIASILATP